MIALADKITKSFGGRVLYSSATLQLNAGERWALVGPNGAGKTTLLRIVMSYRVRTQAYSGPFDLLLQLVSRQKVAIGSISISDVTEQYLAEVSRMGDLDLDVASDFVLVASTLLEMKAAALVPDTSVRVVDTDVGDDGDLEGLSPDEAREVLIARLVAYKQFRNAGTALAARAEAESRMFLARAYEIPFDRFWDVHLLNVHSLFFTSTGRELQLGGFNLSPEEVIERCTKANAYDMRNIWGASGKD